MSVTRERAIIDHLLDLVAGATADVRNTGCVEAEQEIFDRMPDEFRRAIESLEGWDLPVPPWIVRVGHLLAMMRRARNERDAYREAVLGDR
jgi:hypothetical protein